MTDDRAVLGGAIVVLIFASFLSEAIYGSWLPLIASLIAAAAFIWAEFR